MILIPLNENEDDKFNYNQLNDSIEENEEEGEKGDEKEIEFEKDIEEEKDIDFYFEEKRRSQLKES